MVFSPLINQLINALRSLPGIGPKSAQRLAFHLLERDRANIQALADTLTQAASGIRHCARCRTLTETDLCPLCSNNNRDDTLLCIVETPIDLLAIEQTASYRGRYFVLMGHLSPLDGIGPEELGINDLVKHLATYSPQEVILATNSTVEGEATAHYLANLIRQQNIRTTRLAHGVPLGGELEFIDANTLSRALAARDNI
jgi:recombination protein RecR